MTVEKTCAVCGRVFDAKWANQQYCTQECRAYVKTARGKGSRARTKKTDWAAIGRLMQKTGKSYGKLVQEGLL